LEQNTHFTAEIGLQPSILTMSIFFPATVSHYMISTAFHAST